MARNSRRSGCPICISLELFGDRWSLLVVRDLMFSGYRSFREFAAAGERIATNVLADRLHRLEAAGIVVRQPHPKDLRKAVYRLTEKGIALAPMLVEMIIWAARYERTAAPPAVVKRIRNDRARFIAGLRKQWVKASA
jgi:DNA-binding HxlR family transcriptional regulator